MELERRTIPELFQKACNMYTTNIALRKKELGIWRPYTWKDYLENVQYFALGLRELGFEKGGKLSIIGDNEPEWVWAMFAAMTTGGVLVAGCYPDSTPVEIKYVLEHSGATFAVVEDQEQVDKMLELKEEVPQIRRVIYWDPKGLWNYNDPWLLEFQDVLDMGRKYEKSNPGIYEKLANECRDEDLAAIFYTSGTTGLSKGVMLSQKGLISSSEGFLAFANLRKGDDLFCLSPLGWIAELVQNLIPSMMAGSVVNFPEEPETVPKDLREIGYQAGFVGIKAVEAQVSDIQVRIRDASLLNRIFYTLFMPVAFKMADSQTKGEKPGFVVRALNWIGYWLLFRPIQDDLGYVRSRILLTGGSALAPDAFRFFRALGITLVNAYGQTEMTPITAQKAEMKLSTEGAGVPLPNMEVKISPEGEVLARGPNIMMGYYENPEATTNTIDAERWLHTGDAGFFNDDGELVIIDRVKDLATLNDRTGFSPLFIENKLKFSPFIREAVALGNGHDFVAALVSIDFGAVGKWAESKGVLYTTFMDLSQKKEVYDLIRADLVKRVNPTLPAESRMKKFTLLPKELDADDAELTRTRKLRRSFVGERYREYIDALYGDVKEHTVEFKVTYSDGKEAMVKTAVKVISLE